MMPVACTKVMKWGNTVELKFKRAWHRHTAPESNIVGCWAMQMPDKEIVTKTMVSEND